MLGDVTKYAMTRSFLDGLVASGVILQRQRDDLLKAGVATSLSLREELTSRKLLNDAVFATLLAFHLTLGLIDVSRKPIAPEVLSLVPGHIAISNCILPVEVRGGVLRLAVEGFPDLQAISRLAAELNLAIEMVVSVIPLQPLVEQYYGPRGIAATQSK